MTRFVQGTDREQSTLLPECLEDWVSEDNPVRVVDAFVAALDLAEMEFDIEPAGTGRPSYHPTALLKLYIYGYLNRVHSSRRLENEAGRNVEVMWLLALPGARSQNHRRLPQGQWPWHQESLRALRRGVPQDGIARDGQRRHRRQQIQSGQQSRQELHTRQGRSAADANGRKCGALSGAARHGRPSGPIGNVGIKKDAHQRAS